MRNNWSSDADVLAEGRKYASRGEFKENNQSAYNAARRRALLDQLYPSLRESPHGIVYVLTAPDGMEYVGQTGGPMWRRLMWHLRDLQRAQNRPICAAFAKYGRDAMRVTIIASGVYSRAERVQIEAATIAERNTVWPNGLNVLDRADTVSHLHTESSREKKDAGLRRFHEQNPDAGRRMIASARKGFNPEQARALCHSRNADPDFQAHAAAKLHERLGDPEYRAKLKAVGQSRAKVKDAELDSILGRLLDGESKASIGRSYGVSATAIGSFIKRNINA